ncbi:MAG TPA: hypothetical protein VE526_01165, partial [Solirubrobacteraceae bacterium]|nr:hypothetical protein [Solirubrobacteraceae bacterium]
MTRVLIRLMMRKSGHPTDTSRDHDFTDWEAVERFARECAGALRRRRVTSGAAGLLVRSRVSLAELRLTGTEGLALCPHLRGTEGLALCPQLEGRRAWPSVPTTVNRATERNLALAGPRGTEGLALCPRPRGTEGLALL